MPKHWKKCLLGIVVAYLGVVSFMTVRHLSQPKEFFSSSLESRKVPEFEDGYLGVLEPANRSQDDDWPTEVVMGKPQRIKGKVKSEYLLDWTGEDEMTKRPQEDRWAAGLQGDDAIELIAFASWVPQPDDDVAEDADWVIEPSIRDARTLEVLDEESLDALGVPAAFRTIPPSKKYRTPKLRLLFRSKGMEYLRFVDGDGADQGTDSVVTYSLDSLGEEAPFFDREGDWAFFDFALLAWHDVPLRFNLQVLTGDPVLVEIPQEVGAQVEIENALRLQWLGVTEGEPDLESSLYSFDLAPSVKGKERQSLEDRLQNLTGGDPFLAAFSEETPVPGEPPYSLLRSSSRRYLESHTGWLREDGSVDWEWNRIGESGQILAATIQGAPNPDEPMRLVFLPKITEVSFEIAGLPDQPNPRDPENLFDIRIPRISLPDDPDSAEDHLLGMLSVAAEVDFDIDNLWDEMPVDFPNDRTFRDQTPMELLNWYLKATPGAKVRYDEAEKKIYYNEEKENWWTRLNEWMEMQGWFL